MTPLNLDSFHIDTLSTSHLKETKKDRNNVRDEKTIDKDQKTTPKSEERGTEKTYYVSNHRS